MDYLARLFEEPEAPLYWFTGAQIAQGLTYLVSTSASGENGWPYATEVPIAKRIACWIRSSLYSPSSSCPDALRTFPI